MLIPATLPWTSMPRSLRSSTHALAALALSWTASGRAPKRPRSASRMCWPRAPRRCPSTNRWGRLIYSRWDNPQVRIVANKHAPDSASTDGLRVSVEVHDGQIHIKNGVRVGESFRVVCRWRRRPRAPRVPMITGRGTSISQSMRRARWRCTPAHGPATSRPAAFVLALSWARWPARCAPVTSTTRFAARRCAAASGCRASGATSTLGAPESGRARRHRGRAASRQRFVEGQPPHVVFRRSWCNSSAATAASCSSDGCAQARATAEPAEIGDVHLMLELRRHFRWWRGPLGGDVKSSFALEGRRAQAPAGYRLLRGGGPMLDVQVGAGSLILEHP